MDEANLVARIAACENQLRRTRQFAMLGVITAVALGALTLAAFRGSTSSAGTRPSFGALPIDSLRVREVVIVDPAGTVRARLGGHLPDAVINGRVVHRGDNAAGVLLYDSTGVERSGYVTFDKAGTVALTLDNRGSQVALFAAGPASDDGAAMRLWQHSDWAELKVDAGGPHVSVGRDGSLAFIAPEPTAAEAKAVCTELKAEIATVKPAPAPSVILAACKAHTSDRVCRKCLGLP